MLILSFFLWPLASSSHMLGAGPCWVNPPEGPYADPSIPSPWSSPFPALGPADSYHLAYQMFSSVSGLGSLLPSPPAFLPAGL